MPDPAGHVEWLGKETSAGCTERSFLMRRPQRPRARRAVVAAGHGAARATALLFHGGSCQQRSERHLRMGRRLASAGLAVIAIDGPYHG